MVKYSWSRWGLRSTNGITATEGGPLETGVVSRAERDVIHLVPIHVTAARTTTIATNSGRRHHGRSPAAAIRTLDSDTASGAPIPADETPDTRTAPTYSGRRPGRDARPYTGCDAPIRRVAPAPASSRTHAALSARPRDPGRAQGGCCRRRARSG